MMKVSILSRWKNTFCKSSCVQSLLKQKLLYRSYCHNEIALHETGGDDPLLKGLDRIQVKLMREQCILIDKDDTPTGWASKKDCHLLKNINKGMLHRAFSVFLFNSEGKLLLQQRSDSKITFPGHFTNTCCSHPLYTEMELEKKNALGVKNAAQRRLHQELGIQPHEIDVSDLHYVTRIHYKSGNVPVDGVWGEHEIDYILVVKKDVSLHPNYAEIKSYEYLSQDELRKFVAEAESKGTLLTPWFRLIVDKFLYTWWNDLHDLSAHTDHAHIHRLIDYH